MVYVLCSVLFVSFEFNYISAIKKRSDMDFHTEPSESVHSKVKPIYDRTDHKICFQS